MTEKTKWPKITPLLSSEQLIAREKWMRLWHETLPKRFSMIEKFNHSFPSLLFNPSVTNRRLPRTLEVGAGLGEHAHWENLKNQEYTMLEYREEWCHQLRAQNPGCKVIHGDIQGRLEYPDGYFDRIIAIHVLEHLPDLPKALSEIHRLLVPGGQFDIVIPCEGGLAYGFARKISSERMFKKNFGMDYGPIIRAEHVNTCAEILEELSRLSWIRTRSKHFPLLIPLWTANLCLGLQFKKPESAHQV